MAVTKAVIPAAGLGTRFLPATKASPKEMLPVVDKPAIQYVVEEAVRAGLNDVLMVTGRNKRPLEDHFDRVVELEQSLLDKGQKDKLALVQQASELATIHYVRQGDPRGLGHAILAAAQHVGQEAFAVLLGDDLIDHRDPLLEQMIEVQQHRGGNVVALMEVPHDQISLYGCAAVRGAVTSSRSPSWSRSRPWTRRPATWPSSVATCCRRRCSTCCGPRRRDAVARSRSPTRCS
jgi:UTP--glucose-1-phosphate uridylyltransferase